MGLWKGICVVGGDGDGVFFLLEGEVKSRLQVLNMDLVEIRGWVGLCPGQLRSRGYFGP